MIYLTTKYIIQGYMEEKLNFLIDYLMNERGVIEDTSNMSYSDKENFFRALCNVREQKNASKEFLKIQDEYLKNKVENKGIIEITDEYKMQNKIYLYKGDITRIKADTIVNAANSEGLGCFIPLHNCIDNCIHSISGVELRSECNKIMEKIHTLDTGKAFITKGYNLPSSYVIHTVGPIIYGSVSKDDREKLSSCYTNSIKLAEEKNLKSIVFPCISTGVFNFPNDIACDVAVETISRYIKENTNTTIEKFVFNVFLDKDYMLYKERLENGRV